MIKIIKRDGRKVDFNPLKIKKAITGTVNYVPYYATEEELENITALCTKEIELLGKKTLKVESIQDIVIDILTKCGRSDIAGSYASYRKQRNQIRDKKSDLMKSIGNIGLHTDRDNANVGNNFSSKLLRIASESNKWHNLAMMPSEIAKEHEIGNIYYHDLDAYNLTINCLHVPTLELLKNGFNTGYGTINPPKRIETAAELSCILLQSAQNDMFGGQAHPDFDNDMAYFIPGTREEIRIELEEYGLTGSVLDEAVKKKLDVRVHQAMQAIVYNLNTMHSRAGSQVPFSSVNIGLPLNEDASIVCKAFLEEYNKGLGKGEQPIFPNIIFRVKDGVNKKVGDPYYELYLLACKVASRRMNPTFMNIDADFNKKYYDMGYVPSTMGCRTYLMSNVNGEPGCKGRGNIAPTTINLPRIGVQADKSIEKFFELLDGRLESCRKALMHRYGVLKQLKVKDLPFVAGQGLMKGSEGLSQDDSIEPILKQGTWGIGFIGLAETLTALTGSHHGESKNSKDLGIKIIEHIREYTDNLTIKYKLNFSTYATPAEGLSGRFIKQDRAVFGIIKGVTDKDYYTNSFHIPVGFPISIQNKIDIEAPYHKLCNAGHISYIEVDDTPTPELIKKILDYAYNNSNINYLGINFHMRYCKECGEEVLHGEQHCPACDSTNIQGISRVTGYLSLDERFGEGKSAERADRKTSNGTNNYK